MLDALPQLGIGFVVALSGTLLPGPMLAFITMKSLSFGPRTGLFAAAGHIFVEFGIIVLIALGLGLFLESQAFKMGIGIVGGGFLAVLGLLILTRVGYTRGLDSKPAELGYHPIVGGVLFSTLFNPTVILWWATVGLVTLTQAAVVAGVAGAVFWLIGHFAADVGWFSLISFSVSKGKQLIGGKFYTGLLIACGCTLFVFGGYFLVRYLPLLL